MADVFTRPEQRPRQLTAALHSAAALVLLILTFAPLTAAYGVPAGVADRPAPVFLPPETEFLRLEKDAAGEPESLQTAVSTYRFSHGRGPEVALVGAIHIADKRYFETLNEELAEYDVVLYELVAPKNTRPPTARTGQAGQAKDMLSMLQESFAELLDVTHQLEQMDYSPKNFLHADLSMQDLVAEAARRGDNATTLISGVILDMIRLANKAELEAANQPTRAPADPMALLSNPNMLRKELARSMAGSGINEGIPGFTTLAPYLIDIRNKAALDILRTELKKRHRRIAIFYGAAHLPDFQRRLIDDFGMQRTDTRWLTAWDMTRDVPQRNPMATLFKLLGSMQQQQRSPSQGIVVSP